MISTTSIHRFTAPAPTIILPSRLKLVRLESLRTTVPPAAARSEGTTDELNFFVFIQTNLVSTCDFMCGAFYAHGALCQVALCTHGALCHVALPGWRFVPRGASRVALSGPPYVALSRKRHIGAGTLAWPGRASAPRRVALTCRQAAFCGRRCAALRATDTRALCGQGG